MTEQELRVRTNVDDMLIIKIETVEEGRELVTCINGFMHELLNEVRDMEDVSNATSEAYNKVRYDLKTARHNIQYQMLRLARLKK